MDSIYFETKDLLKYSNEDIENKKEEIIEIYRSLDSLYIEIFNLLIKIYDNYTDTIISKKEFIDKMKEKLSFLSEISSNREDILKNIKLYENKKESILKKIRRKYKW